MTRGILSVAVVRLAIGNANMYHHPSPARRNARSGRSDSPETDLNAFEAASRSAVRINANIRGEQGHSALIVGADFTATHMHIFYHATSSIASQMAIEGDESSMVKVALDNAFTAPYVLEQMLALSALHYSTTAASSRHLYVQQATELQTRALTRFNKAQGQQSPSIGICSLLFVSLLGIRLLHDTVAVHYDSIGHFVSDFVACMHIHRGVRYVAKLHWPEIRQSGLEPLLNLTH